MVSGFVAFPVFVVVPPFSAEKLAGAGPDRWSHAFAERRGPGGPEHAEQRTCLIAMASGRNEL